MPRGTGWDFVRTFGIPRKIEEAAEVALRGECRIVDLGRATFRAWDGSEATLLLREHRERRDERRDRPARELDDQAARREGVLPVGDSRRLLALDARRRSSCEVDDERRRGRMFDVVVANGRYFGGGMEICPEALPDDGLLDVLTIGDLTKRDLMTTMPKTYRGSHLPHPKAELLRGSAVTVSSPSALPVELDGEQPGTTPVRFEVLPRALRLRVPGGT